MGIWIRWIIDNFGKFFNGFWAKLDIPHWRKTVLVLFMILSAAIGALSWISFQQYMAVEKVRAEYVDKEHFESACNSIRSERKEILGSVQKSIDDLSAHIQKLNDKYIQKLEEELKEAKETNKNSHRRHQDGG